jgi:hypothetical protein
MPITGLMKTTNLKQTSVAKPRKWFQRRGRWHDPREARREGSQFRDQRSRLHIREFAKNSRVVAAFVPGANRGPQFSSLADQLVGSRLARDELILRQRKAIQDYETITWNITGGRCGISSNTLDSGLARTTVRSNGNRKRSAFRFL